MAFAATKSKILPLATHAARLCSILLKSRTTPDVVCSQTGVVHEGQRTYDKVQIINPKAMGAHYKAHGFYYILCYDEIFYEQYVAVHRVKDRLYVGDVYDIADGIKVRGEACSKLGISSS